MRTKILSILLAAVLVFGGNCMAQDFEYSWDFDSAGIPEYFSANTTRNIEIINDAPGIGAESGNHAFAWVRAGNTKGNGKLEASTDGFNIGKDVMGYINDTTLVYSVSFKSMNKSMHSYIAAPRFGENAEFILPVKIEDGSLYFGDTQIGEVTTGEWTTVGVKYELSAENGVTAALYADGEEKASQTDDSDSAKAGIAYFSLLGVGKTTTEDYRAEQTARGRNEIVYFDDLYIGSDLSKLGANFSVTSVKHTMKTSDVITVSFSKEIDEASFSSDFITVEGREIRSYTFGEDKKTVILKLDRALEIGTEYKITFGTDIKDISGNALSKETTVSITAVIDPGVNRSWNFDNLTNMPDGFKYNNKSVPLVLAESGRSGDDKCFGWLAGIGNGAGSGDVDRYSNGVVILRDEYDGGKINNVTIAVDYDFKFKIDYMCAWMLQPIFAGGEFTPVSMSENNVYFNGELLGHIEKDTWHNIGVVYNLSSTDGLKMDIYLDSVKKVSGYTVSSSVTRSGISCFRILHLPNTPAELAAQYPRFDTRNEYYFMDNLYIGEDVGKAYPNQSIASVSPENGSKDVDIASNVTLKFAADVDESTISDITLSDENGNAVQTEKTLAESDTVIITPSSSLLYGTNYKLTVPKDVKSTEGKSMAEDTVISFKTATNYDFEIDAVSQNGGITVDVSNKSYLKNNIYAAAIMKKDGNITGIQIENAEIQTTGKIEFDAASEGEAPSIILFDDEFNIMSAPWYENVKTSCIDYSKTSLNAEVATKDKKITISGTAEPKNGFVICKVTKSGKSVSSENADDYILIDVCTPDDNGNYSFAVPVTELNGEYEYAVSAYGTEAIKGKISYALATDNKIESFSLNGTACSISGNAISATINGDLSGLIAEFKLSDKAYIMLNGERLESGESRIDCRNGVVLTVYSEAGESREYTLRVSGSSSSGSGSSGGSSGGGGIKNSVTASVDTGIIKKPDVADPIEYGTFTDVTKNHWAYEAIESLAEKKIASGDGTGNFNPDANVKREEFAKLIAAAFGFEKASEDVSFADAPEGAWYKEYVENLASNGVIKGIDENNFGAGINITRQDMAVIILRAAQAKGIDLTPVREYVGFDDEADIADYAKEAVKTLYEAGIINGRGDSFEPNENASRAESVYIIFKSK